MSNSRAIRICEAAGDFSQSNQMETNTLLLISFVIVLASVFASAWWTRWRIQRLIESLKDDLKAEIQTCGITINTNVYFPNRFTKKRKSD
ncbi:MAG: hypothetical protein ABI977_27005 [Acidobacteriota bacterium]